MYLLLCHWCQLLENHLATHLSVGSHLAWELLQVMQEKNNTTNVFSATKYTKVEKEKSKAWTAVLCLLFTREKFSHFFLFFGFDLKVPCGALMIYNAVQW